jgi:uncharacterized membrane protein (UPF0127 family)
VTTVVRVADRVLERGERLDGMLEKSSLLSEKSMVFQQASTKLRRDMWWQSVRQKVALGVAFVAVSGVIALSVCGWGLQSCGGSA